MIRIKRIKFLVTIFLFCLMGKGLWAQGFANDVYAKSKAEHILCGVDIYQINLDQVFKELGKPTRVEVETGKDDKQYGPGSGSKEYIWLLPNLEMHMYSDYYTGKTTGKIIETPETCVVVSGMKPNGKIGLTGQGLALGDPFSKVTKIYGKLLQTAKDPITGNLYSQIQWNDSTVLSIEFDADKRVKYIRLEENDG
jgi:hypothetical protein